MSLVPTDPYASQPDDGAPGSPHAANPPSSPAAGWYPDPTGRQRYWDGTQWGHYAPTPAANAPVLYQQTVVVNGGKEVGITYVLAIFLGALGIHNFYLGRTGIAVTQLVLYLVGWATAWLGVGLLLIFGVSVWIIVELFLIPQFVREANARLAGFGGYAANQGYGPAGGSGPYPRQY
ncbi:NINE protein [Pseudoclavibacter helvolus]|uniref:NINE protein n=1 Tax=Pseudoclavibacter helvolus TaxID=255205 RepID=UPI003C77AFE1